MQRQYLLKKDLPDVRDYIFSKTLSTDGTSLPTKIDLRDQMSPIVDQGQLGSCTANAIVSGYREYMLNKEGLVNPSLSRLFLYWHERSMEGTVNTDSGAFIRDGMKTLADLGVCPEADFPYDITKFTQTPSGTAEADAAAFKIDSYHRVVGGVDGLKQALAAGYPVVIGIVVYDSFESFDTSCGGKIPMPNKTTEKMLGGHALLAVGYDDDAKNVIVRNSWGVNWGDHGYCYIPYDFINDITLTNDMWTGEVIAPYNKITDDEALKILSDKKVIDSPDFWKNLETKYSSDPNSDYKYVSLLVRKVAVALRDQK